MAKGSGSKAGFDLTLPPGERVLAHTVPKSSISGDKTHDDVASALAEGAKSFGALMVAVGSRDGREIVRRPRRIAVGGQAGSPRTVSTPFRRMKSADHSGVGAPVRRREDHRLLRGAGDYSDDIDLPDQLFAVMVRSPHAHARLGHIDIRTASKLPGVHRPTGRITLPKGSPILGMSQIRPGRSTGRNPHSLTATVRRRST